ncbi:MAG: short chain dehydrogenase [Coxiellaceae bacterium]|nr:MAG: short chain dehydrogenase [Coxiellaceae bacterium]
MKIIIIGGTGTIGSAVAKELQSRHELILVGHSKGDITVDITDVESIKKMYQKIGKFDAVIATTGNVCFDEFSKMDAAKYQIGLQSKLMGQVNLVLIGYPHINDYGSFTLTSGILSQDPIKFGSSASMVNGAIDSFVKAAAIEMQRGIRINVVSPTVITESMPAYESYFRGFPPVTAAKAALAYSKSVEGLQTGQIYQVNY